MRVVILGTGAIGSVLGTYLAKAGQQVILVGRKAQAQAINAGGLALRRVVKDKQPYLVKPAAFADLSQVEFQEGDVAFLSVKTFDSAAMLDALREAAGDIPVACFQNTVANEPMAAERFTRVYGGCITMGASWFRPGDAVHTQGDTLTFGRYPKGIDDLAREIHAVLASTELNVVLTEDIMAAKNSKLLGNLLNALAAVANLSAQDFTASREARLMRADVMEEGIAVLKAKGLALAALPGRGTPEDVVRELRRPDFKPEEMPPEKELRHWPSMWQDLYHKRGKTEVAWFNGTIERMGREVAVPTPLNSTLVRLANEMAENRDQPGKYTIAQIRQMAAGA